MGLDSVELVIAIEEAFGIDIPDEDAQRIVTARDVIDYVYPRIQHRQGKPCPTQSAFHRLRAALGPQPEPLRPATQLQQLLPRGRRRAQWPAIGCALGVRAWPRLQWPKWVVKSMLATAGLAAVVAAVLAQSLLLGLAAAVACWLSMICATGPLRVEFPVGLVTVGDLASHVAERSEPPTGGWTRDAVRQEVRRVVCEQVGVDDSFSDDAHFVRDLGID